MSALGNCPKGENSFNNFIKISIIKLLSFKIFYENHFAKYSKTIVTIIFYCGTEFVDGAEPHDDSGFLRFFSKFSTSTRNCFKCMAGIPVHLETP